MISSGYTEGGSWRTSKVAPRQQSGMAGVAYEAKGAPMSPKGLADWTCKTIPVSCWFRCSRDLPVCLVLLNLQHVSLVSAFWISPY